MKLYYTNDFTGHYPVGTAAIVLAKSEAEAYALMRLELEKAGLLYAGRQDSDSCENKFTLVEVCKKNSKAIILRDGDY